MDNYRNIIVGIDLSPESTQVVSRAAQMAQHHGAEMHIIHVIEPLTFAYGGDIPLDLSEVQDQMQSQAKEQLDKLAQQYNIAPPFRSLRVGQPAFEMHQLAAELNADAIVVGSHGRQGLALLLGSTANGVLHGANCDVIAVRVSEAD